MRTTSKQSASTLVETMIGTTVTLLLGGVIYGIFSLGTTLYTQNVSLGQTQQTGRDTAEKLFLKIAAADETPQLIDATGAAIAGNGPAAGLLFYNTRSAQPYSIPVAVLATSPSMNLTKTASQSAPAVGDKISMADLGFQGVITNCITVGSSHTVSFATMVGNGFTPTKLLGTAIPAGSKCFVLTPSAFISVAGTLRYYPRARSVTVDGTTAFNDPSNFVVVSSLVPASNQSNALPFQYLDPSRRSIEVDLRLRAPSHGGKTASFYTYQNLKTTVAYRTAVTQ